MLRNYGRALVLVVAVLAILGFASSPASADCGCGWGGYYSAGYTPWFAGYSYAPVSYASFYAPSYYSVGYSGLGCSSCSLGYSSCFSGCSSCYSAPVYTAAYPSFSFGCSSCGW
jgi:hypothetical protein